MIITVDKVNKTYKNGSLELQVLKNISFKVDKGEFLAIMGSSGSGKSTMMNILGCLDNQYEGRYILDGIDISKSTENELSEIRNKKIGFIFQSFNLLPRLTALENVELPLVYSSIPKEERHKRANELLEMVGLKERIHHRPNELSGGQRQRLGIARAIACKPKLIIADEPVSALDLSVQAQVLNYLKNIQRELNLSYIFISHDLGVVKHMCDEIYIMYKGRFVEKGLKNDIYQDARHIYTKRLIAAIPDVDPSVREQNMINRINVEKEYLEKESKYYDKNGKVFDLKPLSFNSTHYVALKDEVE